MPIDYGQCSSCGTQITHAIASPVQKICMACVLKDVMGTQVNPDGTVSTRAQRDAASVQKKINLAQKAFVDKMKTFGVDPMVLGNISMSPQPTTQIGSDDIIKEFIKGAARRTTERQYFLIEADDKKIYLVFEWPPRSEGEARKPRAYLLYDDLTLQAKAVDESEVNHEFASLCQLKVTQDFIEDMPPYYGMCLIKFLNENDITAQLCYENRSILFNCPSREAYLKLVEKFPELLR